MLRHFAFFLVTFGGLFVGCQPNPAPVQNTTSAFQKFAGQTMGTTYNVTYGGETPELYKAAVDSLLVQLNQEVSTYIESSTISRFNKSQDLSFQLGVDASKFQYESNSGNPYPQDWHFVANYLASSELVAITRGAFDPTVMPLVNYWGFGYTPKKKVEGVDSLRVDSLLSLVGFEKVQLKENELQKEAPGVELDFSAIAKGYGVDEVGRWLELQGVNDYLVEIGGEVRARGVNQRGEPWKLGINTPQPEAELNDFQVIIALEEGALATSGNYRNFYEVDGRKFAHTINPKTGYPELSTLLSASVIAKDCTTADALATALMVMGAEPALQLVERLSNVEALLIVGTEDGSLETQQSSGMDRWIAQ